MKATALICISWDIVIPENVLASINNAIYQHYDEIGIKNYGLPDFNQR